MRRAIATYKPKAQYPRNNRLDALRLDYADERALLQRRRDLREQLEQARSAAEEAMNASDFARAADPVHRPKPSQA